MDGVVRAVVGHVGQQRGAKQSPAHGWAPHRQHDGARQGGEGSRRERRHDQAQVVFGPLVVAPVEQVVRRNAPA